LERCGLPREAQRHRAIRSKLPRGSAREFIPSGVSGGFPLLSLADASTSFIPFQEGVQLFIVFLIHPKKMRQQFEVGAYIFFTLGNDLESRTR
jgi:hypothetical protein